MTSLTERYHQIRQAPYTDGTYGGVKGQGLAAPSYSITNFKPMRLRSGWISKTSTCTL